MRRMSRALLWTFVALATLAAVFAWYFLGPLPFELAQWWAACFGP